jgi:hypothetical protein
VGVQRLGFSEDLVQPINGYESGYLKEKPPSNTTLNVDRIVSSLGVIPPDVFWTIENAFAGIQANDGSS